MSMKLYVWNLDADGVKNRVMVFASDEQEAFELAVEQLNIDLNAVDRPEPEVFESRAVAFELTNITHLKQRVGDGYRDCEECGCEIQEEGGQGVDGLLCRDCMAEAHSICDEPDESMDGDHGSALASAGWGTDEDYGCFGPEDFGDDF